MTRRSRYNRRRRSYVLAVALTTGICLLQSLVILTPNVHLESDMRGYVERALALVRGTPPVGFERFYPPGTSIFYAGMMGLFGPREIALNVIVLLQAGFLIWSAVVAGRTARLLWRSPRAEILTLTLLALFWPLATLGSFFLSEPLFCALFFTAQWLVVEAVLRPARGRARLVLAGALYGASALVRGQGLFGLLGSLLSILLYKRSAKDGARLLLGATVPLLFLVAFNAQRYGTPTVQIAANDAFNIYLGQSRRAAVSCVNPADGSYYVFHNNNASELNSFLPLELLVCEITDRSFFFERTAALWRRDPLRQLQVSALNLYELFTLRPGWPLVAYEPRFAAIDYFFQLLGLLCFVLPASLLLTGVVVPKATLPGMRSLIGLPLLLFLLSVALSTGQPRYLLPHYYTLIPVAVGLIRAPRSIRGAVLPGVTTGVMLALFGVTVVRAHGVMRVEVDARPNDRNYALAAINPPLNPRSKFWWFELLFEGQPIFLTPSDGLSLTTSGFPANGSELALSREVSIHVTLPRAAVDLQSSRLRAALYFVESPSGWGSGIVKVNEAGRQRLYPVSDILQYRWFSFPLTGAYLRAESSSSESGEAPEVRASFSYQKLSGATLQLKAVVIYVEQLPQVAAPK